MWRQYSEVTARASNRHDLEQALGELALTPSPSLSGRGESSVPPRLRSVLAPCSRHGRAMQVAPGVIMRPMRGRPSGLIGPRAVALQPQEQRSLRVRPCSFCPGAASSRHAQGIWRSSRIACAPSARLLRSRHIPAPPSRDILTGFTVADRFDLHDTRVGVFTVDDSFACRSHAPHSARVAALALTLA